MSHINQFQDLKIQLEAILSATSNFSDDDCIGHGGFGKVYKGELIHSKGKTMVAMKRLDRVSRQGNSEFLKEIMTLSYYKHDNIVSLLGYCDDHGEKILVYEYLSKKSLDSYLASEDLTWVRRLKICVGAARGLAYLHTPNETKLRMVHRDVKSSNILLDDNWNAKISDFGLSKSTPANNMFTYVVTNPAGTQGYIDPLYAETCMLTKESDVYSFGVVLFEVLCGRLCFGSRNLQPLVGLVRDYYEKHKIHELIYSNIKNEIDESSLKLFVDIAYQCLNIKREERPLMTQIVSALENALDMQVKADVHGLGILNVKVHRTTDVRSSRNLIDAANNYLVIYIDPMVQIIKTTPKYSEVNSEWNEELTLFGKDFHVQILHIHVYKVESAGKHIHLGKATMKVRDLTPRIPSTFNLNVKDDNIYGYIGDLEVEVLYRPLANDQIPINMECIISSVHKAPIPTTKDGGLLIVTIHGAMLHPEMRHSSVTLFFRGAVRETQSIFNTNNPMWVQEFTFMLEQPPTDEKLHFEVIDNASGMESIGCYSISLANVVDWKWTNQLCALEPGYRVDGQYRYNYLQLELHWRTSSD